MTKDSGRTLALTKKRYLLWADAIAKEMKNIKMALNIVPNGDKASIAYLVMKCHMDFSIKMDGIRSVLDQQTGLSSVACDIMHKCNMD